MNYSKIYDAIVSSSRESHREKSIETYYESHHIKPICMGGTDDKSNLVLLTVREHILCHWLLVYMFPEESKLIYAFNRICNSDSNKRITSRLPPSRLYKYARSRLSKQLKLDGKLWKENSERVSNSKWMKEPSTGKCIRVPVDFVKSFSDQGYVVGREIPHRKPHSKETIERIKIGQKKSNYKASDATRKKFSEANKGRVWLSKNGLSRMIKDPVAIADMLVSGWKLGRVEQKNI